jgi:hypothetical protein
LFKPSEDIIINIVKQERKREEKRTNTHTQANAARRVAIHKKISSRENELHTSNRPHEMLPFDSR